ncbi:uncharacterized protein BX663DRAFT_552659 [Cokeromyces recurvatus]|uniref:uncharacterized protein n=1 Tax=Cokeromyces recurvatus TaxID=90255 RepID=UPI002220378D|nr:uncharacterized protein BX663DRAFT_552659 [Cokeromyces recurvatus]KAI7902243.1 hypothetical protein BX663DRAFT_552659 [Cokeromyces recurvatus]
MKRKRENNPIDNLTISKGKKTLTNVDHDTPTLTTFVSTSRAFTSLASTSSSSSDSPHILKKIQKKK